MATSSVSFNISNNSSSETQGQIVGTRESPNGRKNMARRKVKNGEKSPILGDPGADSGDEGKSKRAEKYGAKKSKERREEPLGTMSYQISSKRSPPFWLLIGARKLVFFWHQSEDRTAATIWNWSGKTLSAGALLAVLYFSSCHIFPPV